MCSTWFSCTVVAFFLHQRMHTLRHVSSCILHIFSTTRISLCSELICSHKDHFRHCPRRFKVPWMKWFGWGFHWGQSFWLRFWTKDQSYDLAGPGDFQESTCFLFLWRWQREAHFWWINNCTLCSQRSKESTHFACMASGRSWWKLLLQWRIGLSKSASP